MTWTPLNRWGFDESGACAERYSRCVTAVCECTCLPYGTSDDREAVGCCRSDGAVAQEYEQEAAKMKVKRREEFACSHMGNR
eukprot:748533-Hanusia_phi.AAC.9